MRKVALTHHGWGLDYGAARLLSLVVVLGGLWQIVAPFVLKFANERAAMYNAIGTGVLLALFAGLSAYSMGRWSASRLSTLSWLASLTGLWLTISPFVLRYREIVLAFWSALIVGLVSFIVAAVVASQTYDGDAAITT